MRYVENPVHFYGVQYTVRSVDDNNLYFILTGYDAAGKRPDVTAPSSKGSNMYAASCLYGLANRVQMVDYDTGGWVDHSTGKPLVSAIPSGKWILVFGSPSVHNCAYYYTTVSCESPAYGQIVGGYYQFVSRTGKVLYSQDMSKVGDHEDSGVLMVFKDADGRFVVIIYGVGYQGAWAAATYFKERIWMTDSSAFDGTTYVVHWVDSNMDGVPQLNETFLIPIEESYNAQHQVTITAGPAGSGSVSVDGVPVTIPYTFYWSLGSSHMIQAKPLTNAPFAGWSCSGSISCSSPISSTATVSVNGAGTVIANFGNPVSFDFRLSSSGSSSNLGGISVAHGNSGQITITVSLVNGPTQTVSLSCTGLANGSPLPSGVSCGFVPVSGSPPFSSTLTVTTSPSTPLGFYALKVIATAGGITRQTMVTLIVT